MTIYLSTAEGSCERGGVYHGDAVRAGRPGQVISLVSDLNLVRPDQRHLAIRLEDVTPRPGDVLVVTSAEPFPVRCADQLADRMPVVASSMAYLVPKEAEGAERLDLRNRAAGVTVQSAAEWASFSTAVGLPADHPHEVVGYPRLDAVPRWRPAHPRRIAVLTGVTPRYPGEPGRTPDGELALVTAKEFQAADYDVVVCPHPREDPTPYRTAGLRISDRRTIDEVSEAAAVVGIPGTASVEIAAMSRSENGRTVGPPFVGVGDHSYLPGHLRALFTPSARGTSVIETVRTSRPIDVERAAAIIGPTGGAGRRQLAAWQRPGNDAADRAALGRDIQFVLGPQNTGTARAAADRAATVTHLTPKTPAVAPRVIE